MVEVGGHPPGLLLIRGLGHSGSTILDLALGAHPQMLGLGEALRILQRPQPGESAQGPTFLRGEGRFKRRCTCGALAGECPVWGPSLEGLVDLDQGPLESKLLRLLKQVESHHRLGSGSGLKLRWIVESYQADTELVGRLATRLDRPVKVVFLTRDVRSWAHSEARRVKGRHHSAAARALLRWWRVNQRLAQQLEAAGCSVFNLGYEELALAPEAALQRLCSWLELDFQPAMLTPGECSSSHILSGNRMRFEPEQTRSIRYDAAWLASRSWPLRLATSFPPIAALNRRLVYSNDLLGRVWP